MRPRQRLYVNLGMPSKGCPRPHRAWLKDTTSILKLIVHPWGDNALSLPANGRNAALSDRGNHQAGPVIDSKRALHKHYKTHTK